LRRGAHGRSEQVWLPVEADSGRACQTHSYRCGSFDRSIQRCASRFCLVHISCVATDPNAQPLSRTDAGRGSLKRWAQTQKPMARPAFYSLLAENLDVAASSEIHEITEALVQRLITGADITEAIAVLNSVIRESGKEAKEELVVGFLPSVQIALSGVTKDIGSYGRVRAHIYPALDQGLRAVWRRWEEQLPFGSADLLKE
jgi:hypothetical protein